MRNFFKRGAAVGAVAALSLLSSPAHADEIVIVVKTHRACVEALGVTVCTEWKTYEVRYVQDEIPERTCVINGNPC